MAAFELHPALAATSALIAELELSQARLQNDARFPWIVLVPRIADMRELDDLDAAARTVLMEEIVLACEGVRALGALAGRPVEKLNVGALGNVTPQLHVHVLGRRRDDGLWPDPVWGRGSAVAYEKAALGRALSAARERLEPGSW
jgi:diadenosine tetraphosphate (Ap4A) HIT family hydrolase